MFDGKYHGHLTETLWSDDGGTLVPKLLTGIPIWREATMPSQRLARPAGRNDPGNFVQQQIPVSR